MEYCLDTGTSAHNTARAASGAQKFAAEFRAPGLENGPAPSLDDAPTARLGWRAAGRLVGLVSRLRSHPKEPWQQQVSYRCRASAALVLWW